MKSFSLAHRDVVFDDALRRYASARELSLDNSGEAKNTFEKKADEFLRTMNSWLHDNLTRAFSIQFRDEKLTPADVLSRFHITLRELKFRDTVFRLAAACLGDIFSSRYPEYPRFTTIEFTRETVSRVQMPLSG